MVLNTECKSIIEEHCRCKRTAKDTVKLAPLSEFLGNLRDDAEALAETGVEKVGAEEWDEESAAESGNEGIPVPTSANAGATKDVPKDDHGQLICVFVDGSDVWSKGLTIETIKTLKKCMPYCVHAVERACTCVVIESDDG